MAERRCFSMKIVDSDPFVEMPLSTQALYFHLGMRADDDGFINNPNRIARDIGASGDDLKLLIAKRFILAFENGVIVVKHWLVHNTLRKDRLKPPNYPELAARIFIKDNDGYTDSQVTDNISLLNYRMSVKCLPSDSQVTDKCQHKVSKGNIREDNITVSEVEVSALDSLGNNDEEYPDKQFKKLDGSLGRGVVLLTDKQFDSLLDKLGLDSFNHYVSRLADYIISKNASVPNHYKTILKWAEEDARC